MKSLITISATAAAMLMCAPVGFSQTALEHRWDMNSVNDTVGAANGTLLNGAQLTGGVLIPGTNGAASSGGGTGNGLNLPNSAVAGLNGAFSIEVWYTWNGIGTYQTVFSFSDGTTNNYLIAVSKRAIEGGQSSAFRQGTEWLAIGPVNNIDILTQVVTTYDGAGNAFLYMNGVLVGSNNAINTSFNLSSFTQLGIAGNSPWLDPVLTGSISDFRIYSGDLAAAQVGTLFALGADATNDQINAVVTPVPEPQVFAGGVLGLLAVLLFTRSRRRRTME